LVEYSNFMANGMPNEILGYKKTPQRGVLGERPGSNRRPLDPQTSALTN
jgi:hypothetical protein